jgi:hypothetical protein
MTHTRATTFSGLQPREAIRLDGLTVVVSEAIKGVLTYKGHTFEVVYLSGLTATGPVRRIIPGDPDVVAAS